MADILVLKADGTTEPFKVEKLRHSLRRAGATPSEVKDIVLKIENELYTGITTEIIYRRAFQYLRESEKTIAARYSLRRALFGLGPTGFPFEDYMARIFESEGYKTRTRVELKGSCAPHELDVVAFKPGDCFVAEAKFHAQPGIKSDLQVALYSHSRFLDIKGKKVDPRDACGIQSYWIVTNTKFTTTAIKYASCVGLNLLSWGYPKKGNLQERIERSGLYPVTVLQTLTGREKRTLLEQNTVLCRDLIDRSSVLQSAAIPSRKISTVLEEAARICIIK